MTTAPELGVSRSKPRRLAINFPLVFSSPTLLLSGDRHNPANCATIIDHYFDQNNFYAMRLKHQ